MKTKHAQLIRQGIREAKRFEIFKDPVKRTDLVKRWATSMYAYEDVFQPPAARLICEAMIAYTYRALRKL